MKLSSLKQQIEELDAKAAKGPWYYWDNEDNDYISTGKDEGKLICALAGITSKPDEFKFIALSRTAMPELLRRLLVAEEALRQIEEQSCEALQPCENEGSYNPPEWAEEFYDISGKALSTIRGEEE